MHLHRPDSTSKLKCFLDTLGKKWEKKHRWERAAGAKIGHVELFLSVLQEKETTNGIEVSLDKTSCGPQTLVCQEGEWQGWGKLDPTQPAMHLGSQTTASQAGRQSIQHLKFKLAPRQILVQLQNKVAWHVAIWRENKLWKSGDWFFYWHSLAGGHNFVSIYLACCFKRPATPIKQCMLQNTAEPWTSWKSQVGLWSGGGRPIFGQGLRSGDQGVQGARISRFAAFMLAYELWTLFGTDEKNLTQSPRP